MRDHEAYVREVDQRLAELRAKCLGQNTSICTMLPEGTEHWSNEEKAEHITKLLLFSLAKVEPGLSIIPELEESDLWLRMLILYLMETCDEDDRTFASLTKITRLDKGIREFMFEGKAYAALRGDPPFLLQSMDAAILYLLDAREKYPDWKKFWPN